MTAQTTFLALPTEIKFHVLSYCSKEDVNHLSSTCKAALLLLNQKLVDEGVLEESKKKKIVAIDAQYKNMIGATERQARFGTAPLAYFSLVIAAIGIAILYGVTSVLQYGCSEEECSRGVQRYNDVVEGIYWIGVVVLFTLPFIGGSESFNKCFFRVVKDSAIKKIESNQQKAIKMLEDRL